MENRISAWTEAELAYLAGILDGEGCIALNASGMNPNTFNTIVAVGNTNPRLIQWLYERFGGSVSMRPQLNPRCKPLAMWTMTGAAIVPLLRAVLPYLRLKHEQAEILLAYRSTVVLSGKGQKRHASQEGIRATRSDLKTRLRLLNKRGA